MDQLHPKVNVYYCKNQIFNHVETLLYQQERNNMSCAGNFGECRPLIGCLCNLQKNGTRSEPIFKKFLRRGFKYSKTSIRLYRFQPKTNN